MTISITSPRRIPKPVNLKLLDGDPTGAMQADETVDEIESLKSTSFWMVQLRI